MEAESVCYRATYEVRKEGIAARGLTGLDWSIKLMRLVWLMSFGLLTAALAAQAPSADRAFDQLLRAKSVRCQFSEGTTASWDLGKPKLERGTAGEGIMSTFDSIDTKEGRARLITRAGAGDVAVVSTLIGVTFIESVENGGLNITTVFAQHVKAAGERFIAVLSKHVDVFGPLPSQWHGTCQISQ